MTGSDVEYLHLRRGFPSDTHEYLQNDRTYDDEGRTAPGAAISVKMLNRNGASLAPENTLDITEALLGNDEKNSTNVRGSSTHVPTGPIQPAQNSIDIGGSESDDALFISGVQTAANRRNIKNGSKSIKKSGAFQSFGLNANLLKAVTRKGFSVPTPIQRKTIPLILDEQDVVGMARTGSGKTAAFVLPMIEKLKSHSAKIGARALILSPSRELALQTLKVVKEFGKGTDLRSILLVGGDSLEDQFAVMTANPDIVIATPGRFLHLQVEMGLDLSSVQYAVFDEADRLFEMGFAAQLTEILHALPSTRQTLLFSATLPKSLVEFAKAGLQEPRLVRLDAESKISSDLQSAFFTLKTAEKEGALVHILQDIINIPTGETEAAIKARSDAAKPGKKRKRSEEPVSKHEDSPTKYSTIIFVATKHHVEYIATLLRQAGFSVSHAYGSLDQTARKIQVENFRTGMSNLLVVTDVAARGIDIPILSNVINYDFPSQPKLFIHRVGRTARAGQKGWSYSLVREADVPYLLDLQLFLSKRLASGDDQGHEADFTKDVVIGTLTRDRLERNCEWVSKLLDEDPDLLALRGVASKGEKLFLRTRNAASTESARRARDVISSKAWDSMHPLFNDRIDQIEREREQMLARVSGFKPQETIFEIGRRGLGGDVAEIVKKRRAAIEGSRAQKSSEMDEPTTLATATIDTNNTPGRAHDEGQNNEVDAPSDIDHDMASVSSEDLEIVFSEPSKQKGSTYRDNHKDRSFFMSYKPTGQSLAEDRGYGVHSGGSTNNNFLSNARSAAMELINDDGNKGLARPSSVRWDKKAKKYVSRANDEDGSKGTKYVRGESGQKIAASFRSGRYEAWRRANKVDRAPRTGELERNNGNQVQKMGSANRWKHKKNEAPKDADKFRDDFHKRRKKVEEAKEARRGRFKDGGARSEIRGVDEVRKERRFKEKRREKNGKGKKGRKS